MNSPTHRRVPVHTTRLPIRWGDMDAMGHVNNTVYFRYMEQARIEWLHKAIRAQGEVTTEGGGPVIVNASCTFLVPLVYPGECEVRMSLGELGRTSVGSHYEIWKDGRKYAEGAAKIVWVSLATGRPAPLPDALAAPLRALGPVVAREETAAPRTGSR